MLSQIDNAKTSKIEDELPGAHLFHIEETPNKLEDIIVFLTSR